MKITLIISFLITLSFGSPAQETKVNIDDMTEISGVMYYNNQPFSGTGYKNYKSGKKGMEGSYVDGKKSGTWTWWYTNGQIKRTSQYENNIQHGESKYWYKSGNKRAVMMFENGKNIRQTRWDEEGNKLPPPMF